MPLDIFFTFPVLDADGQQRLLVRWREHATLKHHIEELVQQNPQISEATLARHFIEATQSCPVNIAQQHLVAFLANFSCRSATRIKYELEQLNYLSSDIYGFLQDLFQTAFEIALDPLVFFKNFEVEKSQDMFWYFSLKGYTRRKMEGLLRDKVRTIEGLTTYGRTDLGLAARSSEKRVISALQALGELEPKILSFVLAWKCFQEARTAKVIQVDAPQPEQFGAIAQRYNHLKSKHPTPTHPDIDGPTLEQWLKTIGAAIRRYCDRPIESLDAWASKVAGNTAWGDLIVDDVTASVPNTLSNLEIQSDLHTLQLLLENSLQDLEIELKRLLLLKYGLNLTQTEIGTELNKHQASISRMQSRYEENFLKQLTNVFNPQSSSLTHEQLLVLRDYLNEYWQNYYAKLMGSFCHESNHEIKTSLQLLEGVTLRVQDYGQFMIEPQSAAQQKLSTIVQQWFQTKSFNI